MTFIKQHAFETFHKRWTKHRNEKKIDNHSLPAGSPMYFYCHGCECLTDTLPENYFLSRPSHYCHPCGVLADMGLIADAKEYSKKIEKEDGG